VTNGTELNYFQNDRNARWTFSGADFAAVP